MMASVKDGRVAALKKGTATITVKTSNGKKASVKVKVFAPKPTKVSFEQGKKLKMAVGEKVQLKVVLKPKDAESKLTWKTGDKKVATVTKKGVVKAKKPGTVKITVTTENGKKATIKITISAKQ